MCKALLSSGAVFDLTNRYRYLLWRTWDRHAGVATFIMLNPSAADAESDDPTIRRCVAFARSWGFGGLRAVNLFGYRASQPQALRVVPDPFGPDNDHFVENSCRDADMLIAAWGNHGLLLDAATRIAELVPDTTYCLGLTRLDQPRHPLYVRSGCIPTPFRPQAVHPRLCGHGP